MTEPPKPRSVKGLPPLKEIVATKLEQAPISVVLQYSGSKTLRNDSKLVDRTLKLLHVVRALESRDAWLTSRLRSRNRYRPPRRSTTCRTSPFSGLRSLFAKLFT